jgi:hypothetical protein
MKSFNTTILANLRIFYLNSSNANRSNISSMISYIKLKIFWRERAANLQKQSISIDEI